ARATGPASSAVSDHTDRTSVGRAPDARPLCATERDRGGFNGLPGRYGVHGGSSCLDRRFRTRHGRCTTGRDGRTAASSATSYGTTSFERVVAPDLAPVLLGQAGEGEQIVAWPGRSPGSGPP